MKSWFIVELFGCHINEQDALYRNFMTQPRGVIAGTNAQKFIAWGGFDIAVLSIVDTRQDVVKILEREVPSGLFNRNVFFGTLINEKHFSINNAAESLPLVGVTFVKFRGCLAKLIPQAQLGLSAYEWLDKRLAEIKLEISRKLPWFRESDLDYFIAASTGWADCMIVFFGRSYAAIQLAVSSLRNTTVSDVLAYYNAIGHDQDVPKHAVVTTCTVPAAYFKLNPATDDNSAKRDAEAAFEAIMSRVDERDQFSKFTVEVQARPGHLNHAMSVFREAGFETWPTLGRSDFTCSALEGHALGYRGYFSFFLKKMIAGMPMPTRAALSSETKIEFPDIIFDNELCDGPTKTNHKNREIAFEADEVAIGEMISLHTIAALKQIAKSLSALTGDESTYEYYMGVECFYRTACRNLDDKVRKMRVVKTSQLSLRDLLCKSIAEACDHAELCFKDRYRGAYPAGETAAMPSVTYQGSFHKILATVDALVNGTLDGACLQLQKEMKNCEFAIPDVAGCAHLGNSASPQVDVVSFLGVGSVNVPSHLMFCPDGLTYVLHETGHIFWAVIPSQYENEFWNTWTRADKKLHDMITEILCDLFALSVGFLGNLTTAKSVVTKLLAELLPGGKQKLFQSAMMMRLYSAKILYNIVTRKNGFDELMPALQPISKMKREFDEVHLCFDFIRLLMEDSPRFTASLRAVCALSDRKTLEELDYPGGHTVRAMQIHFLAAKGEDFYGDSIQRLWMTQ